MPHVCSVYFVKPKDTIITKNKSNMAINLKIESGMQLLARLTKRPKIEKFYPTLFETGPTNGEIIEISSDECTSYFLVDIISELLIYTRFHEKPAEVLLFETDGNLNYDDLLCAITRKICTAMINANNTNPDNVEMKTEVHKTMARLHITNIYDSTQFYTTIYNLENTLVDNPNISMIIFNTLTAFYWSEQGFKITKMDLYTKNLINTIQKITKEHKIICMHTRPEYFCTAKQSECTEVNYQIQLLNTDNENYQVIIKRSHKKTTKFFKVVDGDLKWIL